MSWLRKKKDVIPEESKVIRADARQKAEHTDALLVKARRLAAELSIRNEENHIAEALSIAHRPRRPRS